MKKSLKIIGIVTLIMAILFVLACVYYNGLKEDTKATAKKTNQIIKAYPAFTKAVDDFSKLRTQFYELKEDLYVDTLKDNVDGWNGFISNYEKAISKVDKKAKILKKNCKIKYGDVRANTRCTTFKANYEAANNYYINDVKMYNKLIDEYESYNEESGNKYGTAYKMRYVVYKKYIDYDKDGEYFGKGGD